MLIQPKAGGTKLTRVHVGRVGAFPPQRDSNGDPYPRHPYYIDARNVTLEDCWGSAIPGAGYVGQAFSVRMGGFVGKHLYGENCPHIFGYFEQDSIPGDVYAEISGSFTGDCAVYLDGSILGRHFVIVAGPISGNGPIVKVNPHGTFLGSYEVIS